MALCVVLEGSPLRGFDAYGPFNNEQEAHDWASECPDFDDEWWVITLVAPDADNKEE